MVNGNDNSNEEISIVIDNIKQLIFWTINTFQIKFTLK